MFTFLKRLKSALSKSRDHLTNGIANLFLGKKTLEDDLLDQLETQLIMADIGIEATEHIIHNLTQGISRQILKDPNAVLEALKIELENILTPCEHPFILPAPNAGGSPFVILMIGVNGAGKTTTIGKISKKLKEKGYSIMLAAGDTFRAAAVEQLKIWGQRNEVPVIAQKTGADSASVIFDALTAATARGTDILIADTAGRLHTQDNLMEELKKVTRVLQKMCPQAPHETLLVLDASTGQNGLLQAQKFHAAMNISGICITKLDGTAKGGIIFAIAKTLGLPIRYIGVGEKIEDLRTFNAKEFVEALFS